MMNLLRRYVVAALLFGAAAAACAQPAAGDPSRPLRMVVPFGPGGNSDFVARIISPKLTQELAQSVIIDNRAGAGGNVGVQVAARANPDGYTLLLGNVGSVAINPSMYPDFPIRPLRDLLSVSLVVDAPGALAVHPSVQARNAKEFIAYAKSRPGKLDYGSTGAGAAQRLEMEAFMRAAGIQLTHVPYKGGAGAVATALMGGEVQATMTSVASVIPFVNSGRLRIVGVATPVRLPVLPDTPTLAESGFAEFTTGSWQALYVPAGTPRAAVEKLHAAILRIMADADVVKRLAAAGAVPLTSKSPQDAAAFLKDQTERWATVVKTVGVTGD
jgi:tripartite-type tricarboxylate transporter receptor subunit TctC